MQEAIRAHELTKVFRTSGDKEVVATDSVSFSVKPGELFSLLGPNGAGKTTTISMLSGLLTPTAGSCHINGISLHDNPIEARRHIGVVPQEIALYPRLSARVNLGFFGRMYGLSGGELKERIDELLDFVELTDRADDRIETFSGGMKRRVNIAVGLLHQPSILYMDEPTVGVDPQSRRRILDLIDHLKEERGIAILYTTHLMEEAEELSDRVGIIDFGKLIAIGTQDELTARVKERDRIELEVAEISSHDEFVRLLEQQQGVEEVIREEAAAEGAHPRLVLLAAEGRRILPRVVTLCEQQGVKLASVRVTEPDLESVFLAMTGRALRD